MSVSLVDGHIDDDTPKMTDEQIIKALECCVSNNLDSCDDCPIKIECFTETVDCKKEALDLINRQKAEIERLTTRLDDKETQLDRLTIYFDEAVNRKVDDFMKRLESKLANNTDITAVGYQSVIADIINLVKEMVGAESG